MSKMMKFIEVFEETENPIQKLSEFILKLQEIMNKIPEEYRKSAIINMDPVPDKYSDYMTSNIRIYYNRIETDEEKAERLEQESINAQNVRNYELSQYEALKKKYGDS